MTRDRLILQAILRRLHHLTRENILVNTQKVLYHALNTASDWGDGWLEVCDEDVECTTIACYDVEETTVSIATRDSKTGEVTAVYRGDLRGENRLIKGVYSVLTNPLFTLQNHILVLLSDPNLVEAANSENPPAKIQELEEFCISINKFITIEWSQPELHPVMQEAFNQFIQLKERQPQCSTSPV